MEDDFRPDLMIAVILFWCVLFWVWAYFFVEPVPPRHHIYWCWRDIEESAVPCRDLDETIEVRHQPKRIS